MLVEQFPTTATGKVQRKVLTSQFNHPFLNKEKKGPKDIHSVSELYKDIFQTVSIDQQSSFDSLGGDSLNYVRASIQLEEYFGYLPDGWDKLSIAELDKKIKTKTKNSKIETSTVLRAIAILAVVLGHSGLDIINGGTQLLIVLVGYNLARFQSKRILSGHVWTSIYKYSTKLIIPYMILVVSYFLWKESFSWDRILMYTNYLPMDGRTPVIFPAWFIQALLILGAIFSFEKVRVVFSNHIWSASYLLLVLFIVLRISFPYIYDTNYLYQRVPPIYLASIWLGWVVMISKSIKQKGLVYVAALVLSVAHLGLGYMSLWLSIGVFFLIFMDSLYLPVLLKKIVTKIASATFYIYLFHMIFIHIPENVLKLDNGLINFVFGLTGSIFIWYLSENSRVNSIFPRLSSFVMRPILFVLKKVISFVRP
jgi:hypothetical protein